MAFFFIPLMTITLSGLPPDRIPAASGLTNFVRITAGAIGTSISTTLWENRAALHHAQLAEAVNPANPAAQADAGAACRPAGCRTEQALAQINRLVDQQAFMLAANDIFWLSAVLFLLLIPLVWLTRTAAAVAARRRGSRRALIDAAPVPALRLLRRGQRLRQLRCHGVGGAGPAACLDRGDRGRAALVAARVRQRIGGGRLGLRTARHL